MPIRFQPALLVVLALAGAGASAQPAPPPPARAQAPAASVVASGRIQQWLVNPNGEVDGLLLADGTQVAVAPHLSASLLQNFKPGDTLQVEGWRAPDRANLQVVRAVRLSAGGRQVADQPPALGSAPPPPPRERGALTAMSASGKVARLLYTDRGDANGVLLDNGSIVRFAPHLGNRLVAQLQVGSSMAARGWGSRVDAGSALEATAIGSSAENMQELFAGPGVEPPTPRGGPGPHGPGRAHPPRPPQGMAAPVAPAPSS